MAGIGMALAGGCVVTVIVTAAGVSRSGEMPSADSRRSSGGILRPPRTLTRLSGGQHGVVRAARPQQVKGHGEARMTVEELTALDLG